MSQYIHGATETPQPIPADKIKKQRELEQKQRYLERKIRKFKRFQVGSCDPETAKAYGRKVRETQAELRELIKANEPLIKRDYEREKVYDGEVDKNENSGIIKTDNKTTAETAVNDVHSVGKIDIEKYKCISNDITTDEVIITDERIQHIHDRHKSDYEEIQPYFQEILSYPDYILEDSSRKNTGLILKQIKENDLKIQMVLRLHTSTDEKGFKNSVISAWKISESRWKNYLKNKKVLYKSE